MNLNFNDKELRDVFNFEKTYDLIVDIYQQLSNIPYCLFEKEIKGYKYLYIQKTKDSKPTSLGAMNDENQKILLKYNENKENLLSNYNKLNEELQNNIKYVKITKMNKVDSKVATILRKMDANNLLGTDFLVVGTNAFFAYEIHAQQLLFNDNLATDDLDFTYYFEKYKKNNIDAKSNQHKLLKILKEIDKSFNINHKKMFQAINSNGYEIEVLASPSSLLNKDSVGGFRPIPLIEQEWLLNGKPIRHILLSNDNKPAPIVAPDPRWMALHKIWLSKKPERNKLKVNKDYNQGIALFQLVAQKMQYEYPFDLSFESELPKELLSIYKKLKKDAPNQTQENKFNLF